MVTLYPIQSYCSENMSDVKPPRRNYRSPQRARQAAETRESILSAARDLFLSQGWSLATVAGIASKAKVSNETVYAIFGSKTALLQELMIRAVRGSMPDVPLPEQEMSRRVAAATDQSRQLDLFAREIASVLERVAPLMDVARTAATTDRSIADLYAGFHRGRRQNLEWFAASLLRNGPLRGAIDAEQAGTLLWRMASPDLYLLVRRVEGLSQAAYAEWLASNLKRLLLPD